MLHLPGARARSPLPSLAALVTRTSRTPYPLKLSQRNTAHDSKSTHSGYLLPQPLDLSRHGPEVRQDHFQGCARYCFRVGGDVPGPDRALKGPCGATRR